VVRVRLVVERRHLAVARRPVQGDGLGQSLVRLQPQHTHAVPGGLGLKLGQEPAAKAEPAHGGGDPHPLDLGRILTMELQCAAAGRLPAQRRDQEQALRRGHLVVGGGVAAGRVEAGVEPGRQLVFVGAQAAAGVRVRRVAHADLDRRGRQQPLHLGHGGDQALALVLGQRSE
jgi:hypothetical protein